MVHTLHCTDLFRPHEDPDDHFDLACQFALAGLGRHKLEGVVIDYPPQHDAESDPDVEAVAQLNYITGLDVPVSVGAKPGDKNAAGVSALLKALAKAPDRLCIHIVGSCRDIALAIESDPGLFAEKCAGIYLNAGSGRDEGLLEYNVALDPQAYARVFDAPCPVYWMPCFYSVPDFANGGVMRVGKHGTYYRFTMGDALHHIDGRLQNYFLNMLERSTDTRWLKSIERDVDAEALRRFSAQPRNMWCTAGFLHAVGLSVARDGSIIPLGEAPDREVFGFLPVRISCSDTGRLKWQECPSGDRFIFTVNDIDRYQPAMTAALVWLLCHTGKGADAQCGKSESQGTG